MKKNNNIGIYILISTIILCCFGYYAINKITLESETVSKVETQVTVNDTGIAYGIENVYDSVVVVENYKKNNYQGLGSGFIYSEEGYIITNHHVVDGADEIKVLLMNGETVSSQLVGSDEYADIAVIKIDSKYVSKIAKLGNSEEMKLGDTVFTIGSPMELTYFGTVTRGILSGKNRMVEVSVSSSSNDWIMNVMQTDAAINPGNSGGPLCNVNGEVIGVNSMKIVEDEIEGIGFSIPIEDAMEYANKIVSGEEIKRSYLGVSMADVSTSSYYLKTQGIILDESITSGVVVISADINEPAGKAGILKGDVIVKIGEYDVKNIAELRYYLYKHEPNEKVSVTVMRGNEKISVDVVLGESKK